jgi:cytoskeleton protein RodZ
MSTDLAPETTTHVGGPGAIMRGAREAKGLHISVLATSLRVPVDRIRALETEKWDDLPDLVFARALAMSVCRHLKIDATPVLAGMPDPDPMRSVRVTAATSQPLGGVLTRTPPNRTLWLIPALLVLAVVAWFMVSAERDTRPTATVEVPEMPPAPASGADSASSTESSSPASDAPAVGGAEAEKPVTVIVPAAKP